MNVNIRICIDIKHVSINAYHKLHPLTSPKRATHSPCLETLIGNRQTAFVMSFSFIYQIALRPLWSNAYFTTLLYVPMMHIYSNNRGAFQKRVIHGLLILRALKMPLLYKIISFNVWVRYFAWSDVDFIHMLKFKGPQNQELISVFETPPRTMFVSNGRLSQNMFSSHSIWIHF